MDNTFLDPFIEGAWMTKHGGNIRSHSARNFFSIALPSCSRLPSGIPSARRIAFLVSTDVA